MRNLILDLIKVQQLPVDKSDIKRCIQIKDVYFILSGTEVHFIKVDNDIIIKNDVNAIDWIPMENVLYMADGQSFECFNLETEKINSIEIDAGYIVHEWNPSQDRIALVNKEGILKIVLLDAYNSQCTYIAEYQLDSTESSAFITVGWGSQTTQFRGSEGKYSANKLEQNDYQENNKDNSACIAWRDDGDLFAVSFYKQDRRMFKIFSYECDFLYECEVKVGLCAGVTWKSDGSLIAVEGRTGNASSIMFFEKNGLFRYDLKLPNNNHVKKIQWNMKGDILMIWQESEIDSEISLWSCTNFKWYLKQSLIYNGDNMVNHVNWNEKNWLEVITSKNIIRYSWKWTTIVKKFQNNDLNFNEDHLGAIVIVDGNYLRVTITSAQIIPPPYSSYNIKFDKPINHVSFGVEENYLAVVLNDLTVKIYELEKNTYTEKFSGKLRDYNLPLTLNNFVYDDKKFILYCVESLSHNHSNIFKYDLDYSTNKITSNKCYENLESIDDLIYIYEPKANTTHLGICSNTKVKLCYLDLDTQLLVEDKYLVFAEDDIAEFGGHHLVLYVVDQFQTLSLNNQHLYYNGKKVANNITSYLFCFDYLILTTTDNKLLCIKLNQKGLRNLESNTLLKVYSRSIPSGALLISGVPGTRKIILQVPRGELEIINPRILAIDEIERLIVNKKYLEAYKIMRTDRINFNLFFDLNPNRFINNIEEFVKIIHNCEYLDVFLLQLVDTNISEELYKNCFEKPLILQDTGTKIQMIADAFINSMKRIDNNFYLQSIITAYLCKGTDEDLEKALEELCTARKKEKEGVKLRVPVENTLEHLIVLTSVEKLYDIALGMDNVELIMWVASKSQQDPLEYIPFLQELIGMEENYRKYKINVHVKRFEKAFMYLIKCDNVLEELKELVVKKSLYKAIIKYLSANNQWYKPLMKLYSEYLSKEEQYKECGVVLMRIEEYKSALDNFAKSCSLKEALTAYYLLKSDITEVNDTFVELATRLTDRKQFQDASYVYENILNNYEESISILIKGTLWSYALSLAIKHNRRDIIETDIKPALLNHSQYLCSNFEAYEEEFYKLKKRLEIIRHEKLEQLKKNGYHECLDGKFIDQTEDNVNCNFDLESIASTTFSRTNTQTSISSQLTSASSRRKKRIEKKVLQIREGSAFENIAIMRRLHIIITQIQNYEQTVNDTCMQLILFPEYYDEAAKLQSNYEIMLDLINKSKENIWTQEILLPPIPPTIESQVYRLNLEHLDIEYRIPPPDLKRKWKALISL